MLLAGGDDGRRDGRLRPSRAGLVLLPIRSLDAPLFDTELAELHKAISASSSSRSTGLCRSQR